MFGYTKSRIATVWPRVATLHQCFYTVRDGELFLKKEVIEYEKQMY